MTPKCVTYDIYVCDSRVVTLTHTILLADIKVYKSRQ